MAARMSSHMPPLKALQAWEGAWFGKCNLMQTLRLHDDFIVECCAHTHTHTHAYVLAHISTYGLQLPWLFRRQQIRHTRTLAHTLADIFSIIATAQSALCPALPLHRASPLPSSMMLLNICIKNYTPHIVEYGKWSRSLPRLML